MSLIELELNKEHAYAFPLQQVLGAGGPKPDMPEIWEGFVPEERFSDIEQYLVAHKIPYVIRVNGKQSRNNGAMW